MPVRGRRAAGARRGGPRRPVPTLPDAVVAVVRQVLPGTRRSQGCGCAPTVPRGLLRTGTERNTDVQRHAPDACPADRRRAEVAGRALACRELPLGRSDLSHGQPAADRAAAPGARQAAAARPLGDVTGPEHDPHPPRPPHQEPGSEHPVRVGARPRRTRRAGQLLAGGVVLRDLPGRHARCGRHGAAVPAVLLPRRGAQPCGPRDPGVHPRRRRARLRALARLRRRAGQPRPAGGLRDRGR